MNFLFKTILFCAYLNVTLLQAQTLNFNFDYLLVYEQKNEHSREVYTYVDSEKPEAVMRLSSDEEGGAFAEISYENFTHHFHIKKLGSSLSKEQFRYFGSDDGSKYASKVKDWPSYDFTLIKESDGEAIYDVTVKWQTKQMSHLNKKCTVTLEDFDSNLSAVGISLLTDAAIKDWSSQLKNSQTYIFKNGECKQKNTISKVQLKSVFKQNLAISISPKEFKTTLSYYKDLY